MNVTEQPVCVKELTGKTIIWSVFKIGDDTSFLLALPKYRCSYVNRIRNLKKLFKDNFIFNSVNNPRVLLFVL